MRALPMTMAKGVFQLAQGVPSVVPNHFSEMR